MPLVHIDLMQGRSPEQVADMIREVSHAIASALDSPIESIRVVVNEMATHQYGVGGEPWAEVLETRRKMQEEGRPN